MAKTARDWIIGGTIALVVAGAIGTPLFCVCRDKALVGSAPGLADGALMLPAADGTALLLFDVVTRGQARGKRVTSIDVATGRETGRFVRDGYSGAPCHAAIDGRAWCDWRSGNPTPWLLVDVRTLKVLADVTAAVKAAKLGHLAPRSTDLRRDSAYVTLDDGRIARFDAATLAVTVVLEQSGSTTGASVGRDCPSTRTWKAGGQALHLIGEPRTRVVVGDELAEQAAGRPRGADFLSPYFAEVDVGDGALVLHQTSLDPGRSTAQLSRVDLAGQVTWTVPIGTGCESIAMVGDTLIVSTRARQPRAFALDPATGAVRWRIDR